ncbi:MAG: glutamyl-tRNA reductase [Gammaproteobacteria bacterium]|jgi:glutamyl-tRNA reductase
MGLLALGINHKSANVALRERVAFDPSTMAEALKAGIVKASLSELAVLSTCNRTEVFAVVSAIDNEPVDLSLIERRALAWLSEHHGIPVAELELCSYCHYDQSALRHMIVVSSGLDSMVLGEPQIFGQMKSAFAVAQEAETIGSELARIFPHVFSIAKKVRTDTAIGKNPVSVAYAAVNLSRHIFSELSENSALLIGAGETIELVARHLAEAGVKNIVVANRTLGRAKDLAQKFDAEAVLLSDIPAQLVNADIVISSTASQLPILGKGAVEYALKQRKHRPMLMIDIAVPRDIEEQVDELDNVYLYTIDDLTEIIDENRRSRESEVLKADVIIDEGVENYLHRLRSLDVVATLTTYRRNAENIRNNELDKALKQLDKGESADRVLSQMARNITSKLIHSPSIAIKKAGAAGREDLISWTHDLFDLDVDQGQSQHQHFLQENHVKNASKKRDVE